MTPTLTATSPVLTGGVSTVRGAGFQNRKVCLLLDGQGSTTNIFRPGADGSFSVGITVSMTPKTQKLAARYVDALTDAASTPIVVQTPVPVSAIRFGMAAHFMWQSLADTLSDLDAMKAAGMTYARFDVGWRWGEPSKGAYDAAYLSKLDQVLDACAARGFRTTVTVIETPGWANGGKGISTPPTNPADYASFVGMLARRYASRPGMVWEVWNEENDPHFWAPSPNAVAYAAMLKAAYAAIRAADPDATVLVGGILANNTTYLDALYAAGAGDSFDGVAIHPYCNARAPGDTSEPWFSFKSSVPQFAAILAKHGQASKPIYITEMGWSTTAVSDATRATYFRDAVAIARTWAIPAMAGYTMRQSQFLTFGLWDLNDKPTLSWAAYDAALDLP